MIGSAFENSASCGFQVLIGKAALAVHSSELAELLQ
jgi:hypothetical protein